MSKYLPRALACAAMAAMGVAQAATLDFDSTAPYTNFQTEPYTEDGFTVTLDTGHYDFFPGGYEGTQYINIDTVNFGPAQITFAAAGGGAFDLQNFDVITPGGGLLTSSNGGSFTLGAGGVVSFSGAQWTNIQWFSLATTSSDYVGIDNINVNPVPEPGTYALMSVGLLALVAATRRQRNAAHNA